jgi:arylsulfatase
VIPALWPRFDCKRAAASFYYDEWHFRRGYLLVPAQVYVGKFMASFTDFPPRSKPASLSVGDALKKLEVAGAGGH